MEFINPKKKKFSFKDKPNKQSIEEKNDDTAWLESDDDWLSLKEKVDNQAKEDLKKGKVERPRDPREDETVEVNIKLSVPKLKWIKINDLSKKAASIKELAHKKIKNLLSLTKLPRSSKFYNKKTMAMAVLTLVVSGVFVIRALDNKPTENSGQSFTEENKLNQPNASTQAMEEPVTNDPEFPIVLPPGIPRDKIAYNPDRKFAKYDDQIGGVPLTVSQQQMPDNFRDDPRAGAQSIAKSLGADTELRYANNEVAYYFEGESGTQTAVFTKNNLLIFIRTAGLVQKDKLSQYIASLK
jgi:hypothetical protein